jgi:hypothetical protein
MRAITSAAPRSRISRTKQKGYALLMAIFLVATMIVLATVVTPSILTEGRREREQDAIWRGNQYVRAIELYYRKNGRYPQSVDDLVKGSLGVHFLRKAYTDPTNSEDGSWRFIYVSPSGQLIGSVRYHSLQEMALDLKMPGAGQALPNLNAGAGQQPGQQGVNQQGTGPQAAQLGNGQQGSAAPAQQSGTGQNNGQLGGGQPGTGLQAIGGTGDASQQGALQGGAQGQVFAPSQGAFASSFSSPQSTQPTFGSTQPASAIPLQAVDGPVLGANLIGVAGKVKRSSLIVYQGGASYFEWEFIYNPLSVLAVGGQPVPGAPGTPPVTPPGPNGPAGAAPGFPSSLTGGGNNTPLGLPPMTNTP